MYLETSAKQEQKLRHSDDLATSLPTSTNQTEGPHGGQYSPGSQA